MTRPRTGQIGRNNYNKLDRLIKEGKNSLELAAIFQVNRKTIQKYAQRRAMTLVPVDRSGVNNPAWRGGYGIDCEGYIRRRVEVDGPYGYLISTCVPGAKNGRALDHRIVMHDKLGRRLLPGEVVHHIDDDKANNHPDNLELFATNSEHISATMKGVPHQHTLQGDANRLAGYRRWRAQQS